MQIDDTKGLPSVWPRLRELVLSPVGQDNDLQSTQPVGDTTPFRPSPAASGLAPIPFMREVAALQLGLRDRREKGRGHGAVDDTWRPPNGLARARDDLRRGIPWAGGPVLHHGLLRPTGHRALLVLTWGAPAWRMRRNAVSAAEGTSAAEGALRHVADPLGPDNAARGEQRDPQAAATQGRAR